MQAKLRFFRLLKSAIVCAFFFSEEATPNSRKALRKTIFLSESFWDPEKDSSFQVCLAALRKKSSAPARLSIMAAERCGHVTSPVLAEALPRMPAAAGVVAYLCRCRRQTPGLAKPRSEHLAR